MPAELRTVLLTGASGFIGRHCIQELLDHGFEVHALSRQKQSSTVANLHWHEVDVFDPIQTRELVESVAASHLVHAAWYVEHGLFWRSSENLRCVSGSLELVRHFRECGGQRALVLGTCYEYDLRAGWMSEASTPLSPTSLYGVAKDSLRRMLDAYAEESGLSLAWGRVFFPFGPHEGARRLLPSVIRSLLHGEPARCSAGTQIRDFLHVEDLAAGLVALLSSQVQGPVNVCSGVPCTIADLVKEVGDIIGRSELIELGALPMGDQPPFLVGDVRRLAGEVGFSPQRCRQERLRETIDWWREQPV